MVTKTRRSASRAHVRRWLCMLCATLMLFGAMTVGAGAASYGLPAASTPTEVYLDGYEVLDGDCVIWRNTTYVPLRAVSQSIGKSVKWDGPNQRAYIGEVPGEKQYLLTVCPPYQKSGYNAPATIAMMGQKYANGFTLGCRSSYALFNLNGQYDTLSFDVGHIDEMYTSDATLNVYLDGELAFSLDLNYEMLVEHYEIPLRGALQMKVEMIGSDWDHNYGIANVSVE